MIICKSATILGKHIVEFQKNGATIGFVPTMGALHDGHASLVLEAKKNTSVVVCSIFVNPTQFNDPADFEKYPITIEKDIEILEKLGCDILFLPNVQEIYPDGVDQLLHYELGKLENILEGEFRPGHFQGVCNVVDRLLAIVKPTHLFLGQKDFQQCLVIKKLIELNHFNVATIIVPTVRESSGLAMSSRNTRLNEADRKKAALIFQTMTTMAEKIQMKLELSSITAWGTNELNANGFKTEYISIAKANTMETIENIDSSESMVILVAAFLDGVRLIDNLTIA